MAKGYQSYRGRHSAGMRLLIILLAVILVAACGFLVIQRYISYTYDGGMYLELPLVGRVDLPVPPRPAAAAPEEEDEQEPAVNVVVDAPEEPVQPAPDPAAEPEPPADVYGERHLVELAALPADAAALSAQLAAFSANGFLWQVRDNTGLVRYASGAALQKAVAADAAAAETVSALCAQEGTVAVARFNALHDSYYAFANMKEAAVCQRNGYVWYDSHSYHWLDPSKELARSYVIGLAMECAQLGFDEILLEEFAYPAEGKLQKIDYSGNTMGKTEALTLLLQQLRDALEPYSTRLSLLVTEELLQTGADEESGQSLAAMLPLVDAVYVATADPAAAQARLAAFAAGGAVPALVPLTAAAVEGNWCVQAG